MAMTYDEVKTKPTPELEKLLKTSQESVRDLRFRVGAKQHKDVRELREAKHLVAWILTILNERRRHVGRGPARRLIPL